MNELCQSLLALLASSTKVDELEEYKNSGKLRQPLVALRPFPLCKKDYKVEEYKNSGYSEAFNGLCWPFWLFV